MTASILNVTAEQYLADPCSVPSLSQSIARTLVTRSCAHAYAEHPRLGGMPRAPTKATDQGEIIHRLILGQGAQVEVLQFDNYRKKVAQEARDAAREAGRVPLLEREYTGILTAAESITRQLDGFGIKLTGRSEIALAWDEKGEHGPVSCRGKLDHLIVADSGAQIIDVKKIESAEPAARSRHAYTYGIDIQAAAYTSAVEKAYPALVGRVDFLVVFMEIEPPYSVVPARLDGVLRTSGELRWQRAVRLWEMCTRANHWPSYTESITTLDAPGWLRAQMEAEMVL